MIWSKLWEFFCKQWLDVRRFSKSSERRSLRHGAFFTPMGLCKWKWLPIGLASAPAAFQNLAELVFSNLKYHVALVFLDSQVVFGIMFEELYSVCLCFLHQSQLEENGLEVEGSESVFFSENVPILGVLSRRRNWKWPNPWSNWVPLSLGAMSTSTLTKAQTSSSMFSKNSVSFQELKGLQQRLSNLKKI